MATKVPGGKAPEKIEPLLGDGNGVVADNGDDQVRPVLFLNDHQLPPPDAGDYPPGEDPDTLAALRKAGFAVEVIGGGGLTGRLKE